MAVEKAPDFCILGTGNKSYSLDSFSSDYLVLYFYPRDNTPGCTVEASEFSSLYGDFLKLGCDVCGISPDSISSHDKFRKKLSIPFVLLSDSNLSCAKKFGAIKSVSVNGNEKERVMRSTFIIDLKKKEIIKSWLGVRAKGHAKSVLDFLKTIK